jgi:hypothetical protein
MDRRPNHERLRRLRPRRRPPRPRKRPSTPAPKGSSRGRTSTTPRW